MAPRRSWEGKEWEGFVHQLVQIRHGAQNVQRVPDRVRGDAGLEYFTMDGCLYQSYAPEETGDVPKAVSAMKSKASRDLKKLIKNQDTIKALLGDLKVNRWILLCPFLDDKDVVRFVRERGDEVKAAGLPFIDDDFRALVHSQEDFAGELETLQHLARGPKLRIEQPDQSAIDAAVGSPELVDKLVAKLERAFSGDGEALEKRKHEHLRAYLTCSNTLETMRYDHPELWERSLKCLDAEERKLQLLGAKGAAPTEQLQSSLERLEAKLGQTLPDIEPAVITQISAGTLSDWLIRCPLDFPEEDVS